MTEDVYDEWNREKKKLNDKEELDFYIKPREIWYTKMGQNIGFEENGKREFSRPVLVLNKIGSLFFTAALTTKGKSKSRFYYLLRDVIFHETHKKNSSNSSVILSQLKVMDKKRFEEKIGVVGSKDFSLIKEKVTRLIL